MTNFVTGWKIPALKPPPRKYLYRMVADDEAISRIEATKAADRKEAIQRANDNKQFETGAVQQQPVPLVRERWKALEPK